MLAEGAYPVLRIEDILDRVGTAKLITTLDLARGFWQVPVADEDRHKTTSISPFGLYQSCVMPFGRWSTHQLPVTYQQSCAGHGEICPYLLR